MAETFNLAKALSNFDLQEGTLRRILAERMSRLTQDRSRSVDSGQQGMSDRGLLHSSIALKDFSDRNSAFDRQVFDTNEVFNSDLNRINQGRVEAENAYQIYLAEKAKQNAAATPVFNPADPMNWQGIAKGIADGTIKDPRTAEPPADDPLNWRAIAEGIQSGAIADPRRTSNPAARPVSMKPPTTARPPAPARPSTNRQPARPKQGYY